MDMLLLFFALPIATIVLSIVLQKILKCPLLVAATFFAIYLIVTYAAFDSSFLVYVIIYTILAFVTAIITQLICNLTSRLNNSNNCLCSTNNQGCQNTRPCLTSNTVRSMPCVMLRNGTANVSVEENSNTCNQANNAQENSMIIIANDNNTQRNNTCRCGCRRRF